MRPLLAVLLLLAAPAAAAAKPLDADRGFARAGVLRMNEPVASRAVISLPGGGTLHATDGAGILRLSARGRQQASSFLAPAGTPEVMAPARAGALVLGNPGTAYGMATQLGVWRVDRDGTSLGHHLIGLPSGESGNALRLVRRGRGYVAVVESTPIDRYRPRQRLVALNADGTLDTSWGRRGFRRLPAGSSTVAAARNGSLVIATALETRCDRRGYNERREQAYLRIQRIGRDGTSGRARRMPTGGKVSCPLTEVGDLLLDRRGAMTLGAAFGRSAMLMRLRRNGTRDARFGRGGVARIKTERVWSSVRVERRRGGYAFGYTDELNAGPWARVGLISARGRNIRIRGLKRSRNYPHSTVLDIAVDRRGGIVAAGSLFDTDVAIREDYGEPHLAIWRVKTS